MKLKSKNYEDSVIYYVLLLLSGLNFLGSGSPIFLVFCCYALLRRKNSKIPFGMNEIGILMLFFGAFFASLFYYGTMDMIRSFNFLFPSFLGYMGYFHATDKKLYIKRVLFSIYAGFFIHVLIVYIYNKVYGLGTGRVLYSVWTGQPVAVTLIGLLSSVVIGYAFYGVVLSKKKALRIITLISVVLNLVINSDTATRTPFLVFFITIIFTVAVYMFSRNLTRAVKVFSALLAVVFAVYVVYRLDIAGFATLVDNSPITIRFESERFDTRRGEIFMYHLEHMWEHPFGGGYIRDTYSHAHNYIQEAHDIYGIFALIGILLNFFAVIHNLIYLVFKKNKADIDYLLISFTVAVLIQLCLEPVLTAYPILFTIFLLFHGIVSAYIRDCKHSPSQTEVQI